MTVKRKKVGKEISPKEKLSLLKQQALYYEEKAVKLNEEVIQLQEQLQEFREKEEHDLRQFQQLHDSLEAQQSKVEELSNLLAQANQKLLDSDKERKRLEEQLKLQERTLSLNIKEKEAKWELQLHEMKERLREAEQALLEPADSSEHDAIRQKLEADIEELKHQLEQSRKNEADLSTLVKKYEEDLSTLSRKHEADLSTLNKKLEETIARYEAQEEVTKTALQEHKRIIEELRDREEKYKQAIRDYSARENRIQQSFEQLKGAQGQGPATPPPVVNVPSSTHAKYFKAHHTPQVDVYPTFNPFKYGQP